MKMSARVSVRRLLSVAALSAFAAAVMLGAASSASATTSATCVFDGAAGPITPGPQGIIEDLQDGNLLDTDTGTYSFATPSAGAACAGDTTSGGTGQFVGVGSLSSSGTYTNSICGTGTVHSTSTQLTPAATVGPAPSVTSADYDITFTAGEGPLTVNSATLSNGDTVSGPGWVSLVPTQPAPPGVPCVTGRATSFDIQGFFRVSDNSGGGNPIDQLLPPGSGQPSAQCTSPTVPVIDSPVAGGYLRLLVQQNGTASTWVCVRAVEGSTSFGGRFVIEPPASGGGGSPSVDDTSTACQSTGGNQAPGPHPLVGPGNVGGQHVLLDSWWNGGTQAWLCVELGTDVKKRVIIDTPGVSGGSVRFERDA